MQKNSIVEAPACRAVSVETEIASGLLSSAYTLFTSFAMATETLPVPQPISRTVSVGTESEFGEGNCHDLVLGRTTGKLCPVHQHKFCCVKVLMLVLTTAG